MQQLGLGLESKKVIKDIEKGLRICTKGYNKEEPLQKLYSFIFLVFLFPFLVNHRLPRKDFVFY